MRYLAGFPDYLDNRLAHDKVNGGLRYLDLSGTDLALLSDRGISKYTFVRDPYSRALSGYLNKVHSNLPLRDGAADNHWIKTTRNIEEFRASTLNHADYPNVSIEVFLLWLRDSKSHYRNDEHWQKQSVLLRWPTVKFDFVGRFEQINADSEILLKMMGADLDFPTQKDVKFASSGANLKMKEFATPSYCELIEEIFSEDFVNFNYPRNV